MRDLCDDEMGGFGITLKEDLLFVTDFILVKQKVTGVSISFEDEAVSSFFEDQVDAGRVPEQFARIWIHSHPGSSPEPSGTDESTFERVFGSCDWALLFIIARSGSTYARLRFNSGPGGETKIPVCVDYSGEFEGSDFELWKKQYNENVFEERFLGSTGKKKPLEEQLEDEFACFGGSDVYTPGLFSGEDILAELETMHPSERQAFMDELAVRSDFWDDPEEVFYE